MYIRPSSSIKNHQSTLLNIDKKLIDKSRNVTVFLLLLTNITCRSTMLFAQEPSQLQTFDHKYKNEEENLNVLDDWITWNNPGSALIDFLNHKAEELYVRRQKEVEIIKTREDWTERQQIIKSKLLRLLGPFPEKKSLNVQITGSVQKEGYRIEKVVLESSPGFYVNGCLFIPDNQSEKVPAVLNLIGHEQEGFRAELDQLVMINLVKKGILVMTIDPPGQGENVQYFDPKIDFSSIGYSVIEHCYFGNQCFIAGISSAKYFIWDAIRAIDYLESRDEVDANRIGVTGFSGGGTITSYVSAIDDRVKVSVPSSWSTASRRQLETKGAQDAEAEIFGSLKEGITFEDLIEIRAPKPTLLTFVSRDQYLALQGAIDCYDEAKRVYDIFGQRENLQLVVDDSRHWLTTKIRTGIYKFFIKHFKLETHPDEEVITVLNPEDLQVTPTGQISTSFKSKRIFDLNEKEVEKLMINLQHSRKDVNRHLKSVAKSGMEISGYYLDHFDQNDLFINGRYQRDGYTVTKYMIPGNGNYPIPFLLFKPGGVPRKSPALIYLHPKGKAEHADPGEDIEKLVRMGFVVVAMDPLGVGETKNTASRRLSPGYTGVLLGKSIVGIQASDIGKMVAFLKTEGDIDSMDIAALAYDEMCLPLIHAGAFGVPISKFILIRPLISYRSVAMNRYYRIGLNKNEGGGVGHPYEVDFNWGVPGVLTTYDLPDLLAILAPRKVVMVQISNEMLEPAPDQLIQEELKFSQSVYSSQKDSRNLTILKSYNNLEIVFDNISGK